MLSAELFAQKCGMRGFLGAPDLRFRRLRWSTQPFAVPDLGVEADAPSTRKEEKHAKSEGFERISC